jgi:hypothetical protein
MVLVTRFILAVLAIALGACSGESADTATDQQGSSEATRSEPAATATTATPAAPAAGHACTLLEAADFEKVGLAKGRAKPDKTISGTECTWDPVLGAGGFLHLQEMPATNFEKRRERAVRTDAEKASPTDRVMVVISGIGDEAFVQNWKSNPTITVKKGDRAVHIGGNARLKQDQLETLARAALGRM